MKRGDRCQCLAVIIATVVILWIVNGHSEGAPYEYPIYVADCVGGTVYKIGPAGDKTVFATGLSHPTAIAVGPGGDVFVGQDNNVGEENGKIYRITESGAKSIFAQVEQVRGLAFASNGYLYVGEEDPAKILRISPDGSTQEPVASGFAAQGLAFDSAGDLYAATGGYGDNRILRIASDGNVSAFAVIDQNPVPLTLDLPGLSGRFLLTGENDPSKNPAAVMLDSLGNVTKRVEMMGGVSMNAICVTNDGYIYATGLTSVVKMDSDFNVVSEITGFDGLFGIAAAPEPATLALLALGGLAVMRRRRK